MTASVCLVETFPTLDSLPFVCAAFLGATSGVDVKTDRATALHRLASSHRAAAEAHGFRFDQLATAEQIHGAEIARVDAPGYFHGVDGLITAKPGIALGIYVADCGAAYLIDKKTHAIGLVHSGKKGTELGIVSAALRAMKHAFGTQPADVVLQLGPCIRPPHYEIDFAAEILRSAQAIGIGEIRDCGKCTAANPETYYSYRREKGETGRMLALLERLN